MVDRAHMYRKPYVLWMNRGRSLVILIVFPRLSCCRGGVVITAPKILIIIVTIILPPRSSVREPAAR